MTREEKIICLNSMLGNGTDSVILGIYLDVARDKILNRMYPFRDDYTGLDVPDRYAMIQLNIAVYLISKMGAEGEIQHIENGIHRNYGSADVPDGMLKDVYPYAQAIR